ncbi:MAG: MFS transporter [Nocardioides sp.]|nr:MFS transporter [Nocardioides sp.]
MTTPPQPGAEPGTEPGTEPDGRPGTTSGTTSDPRRWSALAVLLLVQFMLILDVSIVNVALPEIQGDLGFTPSGLTWVVDGYVLMAGGFLLLGGRLGDVLGRRRMFLAGVVLFGVASVACGLAQSPAQLVTARFVQGIGEALAAPAALGLIAMLFTEHGERAKAIGYFGGISGLAGTAGPILSGVLVEFASWRWIFLVNIPVAVVALVLVPRLVSAHRPSAGGRIDLPTAAGIALGFTGIVYGAIQAAEESWTSVLVLGPITGGVLLLAVTVAYQARVTHPLVPLRFFTDRTRVAANVVTIFFFSVFFTQFFFVTLYLQNVLGFSALRTGFAFLPFGVMIGVGIGAATALTPRLGLRPVLTTGTIITTIGVLLFTRISADGSFLTELLPASLAVALGSGLSLPCLGNGAVTNVTEDDAGLASGLQQALQQVAGAVGLAVLASIALRRAADLQASGVAPGAAIVDGYRLAFFVGAGLLVAATIAALTLLSPGTDDREQPPAAVA